ncbi:FeoB-associated Cys-rich membrane protein [Lachnospiraceae bacterium]|nr:FeoB-associated Cys-rich membrane protein [Lachnospiraceae bacterium]
MGTFVVFVIVAAIAGLACTSIYRDKKRGKCCGGCSGCNGGCACGDGKQTEILK